MRPTDSDSFCSSSRFRSAARVVSAVSADTAAISAPTVGSAPIRCDHRASAVPYCANAAWLPTTVAASSSVISPMAPIPSSAARMFASLCSGDRNSWCSPRITAGVNAACRWSRSSTRATRAALAPRW